MGGESSETAACLPFLRLTAPTSKVFVIHDPKTKNAFVLPGDL